MKKLYSNSEIKKFLLSGKLYDIPIELLDGLALVVQMLLKEGFDLKGISEISTLGQIQNDEKTLNKIKEELLFQNFTGGYMVETFDIHTTYIDIMQVCTTSDECFAIAFNSPGDLYGYVGVIWKVKLNARIKIEILPNTHFDFRRE